MKTASRKIVLYAVAGWGFAVPAALLGVFIARELHMSHLSAAWITFGFFGFAGGAGFVLPIRAAGGNASVSHAMTLSGIWTPCLVAAVIPMFFTMGIASKMAILSLFFFSFFGGLGGLGTAWIFQAAFPAVENRDLLPPAACWGVGLGLAAVCGGLVGTLTSKLLPGFFSWLAGFAVMAAGAGIAGACALLVFCRDPENPRQVRDGLPPRRISGSPSHLMLWTFLLLIPFYLNDLADIHLMDWRLWLTIDTTAVKLWPLLFLGWLIHSGRTTPEALGVSGLRPLRFIAVFYAALLFGTVIDQNAVLLIDRIPGHPRLGEMPEITSPLFARIDLTLGLMLVAACEELVFRGYLFALLRRFTDSSTVIVFLSAAAFGWIHWSGGIHRVVATGLIGAIFMMLYIRSRSLHPLILAHFLINFIAFSELFPTTVLRYM